MLKINILVLCACLFICISCKSSLPDSPESNTQKNGPNISLVGKDESQVDTLYSEGRNFFLKKDYDSARKKFSQALAWEKQNNTLSRKKIAIIYYNLGKVYFIGQDYKSALNNFVEALTYCKIDEFDDTFPMLLYEELSLAYQYIKQYKKGLKYALMAYHFQVAKYGEDDMWTGVRLVGVAMMYHQCANSS